MSARKTTNTTLDQNIYYKMQLLSIHPELRAEKRHTNRLIEEGMQYVLDHYQTIFFDSSGKPIKLDFDVKNRKGTNTTLDQDLYRQISSLAITLGLNRNDLIEIGMKHVIDKYSNYL